MSYPRTGVNLRTSLLGTNPVGLPKTKMSEEHSSVNHKNYSIATLVLSMTFEVEYWSYERKPSSRFMEEINFYLDLSKLQYL